MNNNPVTSREQLTPAWFTETLTRNSSLRSGSVREVALEGTPSNHALILRIKLRYSADATGEKPEKLLIKICPNESAIIGSFFGTSEVDYYARDYVNLADAPLPRCYDVAYSPEQRRYHLLLADLTDTHHINWETVPYEGYALAVAEALAVLHSHWWGKERLELSGEPITDRPKLERYLEHVLPGFEPMLADIEGEIKPEWVEAIKLIYQRHPDRLFERINNPVGFTLVHGDNNPGNILAPNEGDKPVYLIDRQPFDWSLTNWLGANDLAYLMVPWWEPEQRRELEFKVLRQYHATLQTRGLQDYSWEALLHDYRLCVIQSLYVPANWCVDARERREMRWLWTKQLERVMSAYFELGCAEVLD
ncbi:MAG TPA: hypothetical protein VH186_24715 [Chloroflexia bacterium]|nr:hypothetical protein [Chloroflexia bacterium]